MFDISSFTQSAINARLDTAIAPYPEGTYTVQVAADEKGLTWRSGKSKAVDGKPERQWVSMDLRCRMVSSEDVNLGEEAAARGRPVDELFFNYNVMLDLNDAGQLDVGPGKNTKLGALREAVDQNDPEQGWHYDMLKTQMFKVKLSITSDKDDADRKYNNVKAVSHA